MTWLVPRALLRVHPVLGALGTAALFGSAAAVGTLPGCPDAGRSLGLVLGAFGALGCVTYRDNPGCLAGLYVSLEKRTDRIQSEINRAMAPYLWRWGVVAVLAAQLSAALLGRTHC